MCRVADNDPNVCVYVCVYTRSCVYIYITYTDIIYGT